MKFWSWKSQSVKLCSSSEFVEPKIVEYKSYYQTRYGDSYNDLGPYGDPLPPLQDGPWNENEWNDQSYEKLQLPYGDGGGHWLGEYESYFAHNNLQLPYGGGSVGGSGGNWVGEYESYFVGGWGEDMFGRGYGSLEEEFGPYANDKVEGDLCWGEERGDSYYSYDGGMEMDSSSYDDNCWFGYWEDEGFHGYDGLQGNEASLYGLKSLDEMRLCESIFGHWPCLEQGFA